jgi:hypothetical protein
MRDFVKPEATAISRIEYYSILLRNIKVTLLQLRTTKLLIRGLGFNNPNFSDLDDVEMRLMCRHDEVQNACRLLLEPRFEGINFGHNRLNHWSLSMEDIKCGYCKLEEVIQYDKYGKPTKFGKKFILLLNEYVDPTLGKFYSGELIPIEKAIHFIDDIPEKKDKVKGLYDAVINSATIAARYRATKQMP